ncbi:MAG TPA: 50S ribosomal protein L21 [Candidatus Paceibacterota bacterium]|nr:50S ribosomal protein L21 [Candidatus Paceibacterota bacterium]
MFAVIETGGKQYKVFAGDRIKIEKLGQKEGNLSFDKVLLKSDGKSVEIGTPYIKGAKVEGKILKEGRSERKIIFRYHSKTRYRKFKTHRQPFTEVEIMKIS